MGRTPGRRRPGRLQRSLPPSPTLSWHDYLLAETPSSPTQARLRQAYLAALAFARNRLAVVGLAIVILLILTALLAPLLAHQSPTAQNLTARLRPADDVMWFGSDELGRDIYSRIVYGPRITLRLVALLIV